MPKDEDVGYGRPPKAYRFKTGKSGNPKGRPKGSRNLTSELKSELANRITVRENGQPRKVSKRVAILKSLVAKALGGDVKAISSIVALALQIEQQTPTTEEHSVSADEQRLFRHYGQRAARSVRKRRTKK